MAIDMLENNELAALAPSRLGMKNFVNDRPVKGRRMPTYQPSTDMEQFLGIGAKKKRNSKVDAKKAQWDKLPRDCQSVESSIQIINDDTETLIKQGASQKGIPLKDTKALISENQRYAGELKKIMDSSTCSEAAKAQKAAEEQKFQENLVALSEQSIAKAKGEADTLSQKVSSNKTILLVGGGVAALGIVGYLIFKK